MLSENDGPVRRPFFCQGPRNGVRRTDGIENVKASSDPRGAEACLDLFPIEHQFAWDSVAVFRSMRGMFARCHPVLYTSRPMLAIRS